MTAFKFFQKNILIISPESWDHIKVSKHHYAQTLASKNNSVYFLNPPEKNVDGIECKKVADHLFVLDYQNPYTGIRFLPAGLRRFLNRKLYNKFQNKVQVRFDVVILFENSRFYDLDFLPKDVLSIYFQVDENQNFHPDKAANSADLVIAINDVIRDILTKYRTPVFLLPHGFSGHFSGKAISIYRGEETYKVNKDCIKAYYVGYIDNYYVDADLFVSLVTEVKEIDFVFIGPYSPDGKLYSSIGSHTNVRFIGMFPAQEIPELLDEADVLFFAYHKNFLSSSHKVMEYLASGKAIVTTGVNGYPVDPDLFYCSGTPERFIDLFKNVCINIKEANSPDKMKKRIQFAMDNTYEERIRQIEKLAAPILTNK